jgi:hypothetical protein
MMARCERCQRLENEIELAWLLIDAMERVIKGESVSDFEESFPVIREAQDAMALRCPTETAKGEI